jgi:hypothetical protein
VASILRFEPRLLREIAVYSRTEWSPTSRAFVDVLRQGDRPRPDGAVVIRL